MNLPITTTRLIDGYCRQTASFYRSLAGRSLTVQNFELLSHLLYKVLDECCVRSLEHRCLVAKRAKAGKSAARKQLKNRKRP